MKKAVSLPSARDLAQSDGPWVADGQQFRENLAGLTRDRPGEDLRQKDKNGTAQQIGEV